MNILGCLEPPSAGEYRPDGEQVANLTDDQLADNRNRKVGFYFQSFNTCFARHGAFSERELPLRYGAKADAPGSSPAGGRNERARKSLMRSGGSRMLHRPYELRRPAAARALRRVVNEPAIIMAETNRPQPGFEGGAEIMDLLLKLNRIAARP